MKRSDKSYHKKAWWLTAWFSVYVIAMPSWGAPLGTAFTYQGQLKDAGVPANGLHDFEFSLWDAEVGGNAVAGPIQVDNLDVMNGLFTVEIDFGASALNGDAAWLEVAVGRSGEALTTLSSRQRVGATPYALQSRGLFVDDNLNVGIGTDTPEGVLDVRGPNGGNIHLGVNEVGARIITTDAAGNLNLKPRLDGAGVFVRDGNTSKGIRMYGGGLNEIQSVDLDGASPAWLGINPNGGNVGIGTNTPAARLDVAAGDIRLDANQEVLFEDNGQIRSHDDNHRILFRREDNKLELREWGDIILSAGATAGQETASVVVKSSGRVGIGADDPDTALHVRQGASPAGVSAGTFQAFNENGAGVVGHGIAAAATGVRGVTESAEGAGVHGINNSSTGSAVGVLGETSGGAFPAFHLSAGVRGRALPGAIEAFGVLGTQHVEPPVIPAGGAGVFGYSDTTIGVAGYTDGTGPGNVFGVLGKAFGNAPDAGGVWGYSSSDTGYGVHGSASSPSGDGQNYGGWFESGSSGGYGVHAETASTNVIVPEGPAGLLAEGGTAIRGISTVSGGNGVVGVANGFNSWGVYGASDTGYAGRFDGDVLVIGDFNVTGGSKSFLIDHPLDPANRYLAHSCVESSERLNVYRGTVLLDEVGKATVQLPDWFDAINANISYQLTPVGSPAPDLYVAREIEDRVFSIAGGKPGMKVSWTVMAERADPYTRANAFVVERDKPEHERGYYLQPELHGRGKEKGMLAAKVGLSERLQSDPEVIAKQECRRIEMKKRSPMTVLRQDTATKPAEPDGDSSGG